MQETKRQRFKRIASIRTAKLLSMISLLGNCANTGYYKYSTAEVNRIFKALEDSLSNTKELFINQSGKNRKFKL